MQSLDEQCTPLKREYDSCFNLWFEGYLQPALDGTPMAQRPSSSIRTVERTQAAAAAAAVGSSTSPVISTSAPSSAPSTSTSTSTPTSTSSATAAVPAPSRIITNWSAAFRRRDAQPSTTGTGPTAARPDVGAGAGANAVGSGTGAGFGAGAAALPPIDTKGKTRAQVKAEEYERLCGAAWKGYQACLKTAIAKNENLSTLLQQARDDHPLHSMEGLEGTAWDPTGVETDGS